MHLASIARLAFSISSSQLVPSQLGTHLHHVQSLFITAHKDSGGGGDGEGGGEGGDLLGQASGPSRVLGGCSGTLHLGLVVEGAGEADLARLVLCGEAVGVCRGGSEGEIEKRGRGRTERGRDDPLPNCSGFMAST